MPIAETSRRGARLAEEDGATDESNMVLRHFQNLNFECWEHSGKLGFHPPIICLKGDAGAAEVLLMAIEELVASDIPSQRTLTLVPHSRPKPIFKIRIVLRPENDELAQMSITRDRQIGTFEFTERGLTEFREALVCWRDGGEDFSIQPDGSRKARHLKKRDELRAKDLASGELFFWRTMDP